MTNIYFHTNGALVDSPHFHYTFNYPPKGITYVGSTQSAGDVILNMGTQRLYKMLASMAKAIANTFGKSGVNVSIPGKRSNGCRVIHSFNTIPATTKPYIIELESFHALFIGGAKNSGAVKKIINHLSKRNCKKILFWTQNAHDNFHKLMCTPSLKKKSIVLYPGVPLYTQNKQHKIPTIGFIARDFFNKGGDLVLPTMKDFVEAGKAKAIIITDVKEFKKDHPILYEDYNKFITFKHLMPRSDLHKKVFPKIDILFYPGYSDTFGYIFPEAMSHGIPIVTLNGCARKELVNNSGGYVVDTILNEWGFLAELGKFNKSEDLEIGVSIGITNIIADKKLRKSMSDYNYEAVKSGIFSLYNRNEILIEIYKEIYKEVLK